MDLSATVFAARCATLMSRGDTSGIESLIREFVWVVAGSVNGDGLMRLACAMPAAFQPEALQAAPAAVEAALAGRLDDD